MCHDSALNLESSPGKPRRAKSSAGVPPAVARGFCPRSLSLLRCLLSCTLLRRSLLFGVSLDGFHFSFVLFLVCRRSLLRLRLLFLERGSLEALPVKCNLSNAHGSVGLPVSAQLLILLLALVMENQNLRSASFFHQLANDSRACLRLADLAFSTRHCQYLGKLHLAIGARCQPLHSNHISGRHPVLFAAGADNRVHTLASVKMS